jgi:branched-chain amino acid transport system ATP-binding protein
LITLAFADAMTFLFFNNNHIFSNGGALSVARVHLLGLSFTSDRSFVMLSAVVLAAAGVGLLALRRSSFGRRLAAMSDSQDACTTLGMSLTWTKVAVFSLSAGLAGLAGVLFGGLRGSVGSNDFLFLNSLAALLLLAIYGLDSVAAGFVGGITFAVVTSNIQKHFPHVPNLILLLTGAGALAIARNPQGTVRQLSQVRDQLRNLWAPVERAQTAAETLGTLAADGLAAVPTMSVPAAVSASTLASTAPTASAAGLISTPGNGRSSTRIRTRPRPSSTGASSDDHRPPPALELLGIHAAYGSIEVVHGVDLVVPPSSVFALLGPNGAGKSTLLKVVSGTLTPTAGCVHISGVHVNGASPEGLARLGVCTIPEGRGVFANLTVAENLRMMSYRSGVSSSNVEDKAYARFPRLSERRQQLAGTLSGGEQQMLAIARAVSTSPSLLLLDEISMGLAPMIVTELYEVVAQLAAEGIAILVVEQFVRTAMRVADYVAVMSQGRIEQVGQGADVAGAVSAAYMGVV